MFVKSIYIALGVEELDKVNRGFLKGLIEGTEIIKYIKCKRLQFGT